jgi:hypothetical protein
MMTRAVIVMSLLGVLVMPRDLCAQSAIDQKISLPSSQSAITFRLALRQLWQYQVTWTRSYIVSVLSDLEDVKIVEDKLVQNQEKIGDAVKPYYGGAAGDQLAALLREHIVIAVEIVRAAKAKDAEAMEIAQKKGRDNADAIANLFGMASNPIWNREFVRDTFYKHLEFVTDQVNYRLQKDWNSEIKAYDDGLTHVLLIADMLAQGIIEQFPRQFQE